MRRTVSLSLAAVLLLALALTLPLADAGKRSSVKPVAPSPLAPTTQLSGTAPQSPSLPVVVPAPGGSSTAASARLQAATDVVQLLALGAGAMGLLGIAILAARKARGPRMWRPRKRSFEAGRALGRSTGVGSVEEALARLRRPDVAKAVALGAAEGQVRVALARRRGEPCELVAGYLTGLFEEAWACDVAVRHDTCSGRKRAAPCEYQITRAARRSEAAWTRGSAAATGRSPPAPDGRA